jgi:hypothetical protein
MPRIRFSSQSIFIAVAAGLLAYLTVFPLVTLIYGSLKSGPPGVAGSLTLRNYLVLLDNWRLPRSAVEFADLQLRLELPRFRSRTLLRLDHRAHQRALARPDL